MTAYFWTPTEFDPEVLKTVGVSVKPNGPAIGRFGSGLKYAIATILRDGGSIKLNGVPFGTAPKMVRGQEVEIVTWGDEELPFATSYGPDWEPWMAFRELWFNTLDEGGRASIAPPDEPGTVIEVDHFGVERCLSGMAEEVIQRPPKSKLVGECDGVALYAESSAYLFYLEGCRLNYFREPSSFTVWVDKTVKLDLSEERFLYCTSPLRLPLKRAIEEGDLDLFTGSLRDKDPLLSYLPKFSGRVADALMKLNEKGVLSYTQLLHLVDREYFLSGRPLREPTEEEWERIRKAERFLAPAGIKLRDAKVMVGKLPGAALAQARCNDNEIIFDEDLFERGDELLAQVLCEEIMHLQTGFSDETRELQTELFALVVRLCAKLREKEDAVDSTVDGSS